MRRRVELLLKGEWDRAGLGHPVMYPWDRAHVGERAWASAGLEFGDSPRTLAARLGIELRPARSRRCGPEVAVPGAAVYFPSTDRRERGLCICHGLAHCLLLAEGWEHSHADAWLVTGDLLLPRGLTAGLDLGELLATAHAPAWLVEAWAPFSTRLGAAAKAA